jgi:hypothetical protein
MLLIDDAVANFGRIRATVYRLALNQGESIDDVIRPSIISLKMHYSKRLRVMKS